MDAPATSEARFCSECGRPWPPDELAHFGGRLICPDCKNAYAQKLREGIASGTTLRYGGFWIRFAATVIDGIILAVANTVVQLALSPFLRNGQLGSVLAGLALVYLIGSAIGASYEGLFVSRLGATPGKMVLGLKVVRPDGGPVPLGRAVGRYLAKILSGMILAIGFIMAGFDSQKRGLHDILCDTRVIRLRI